MDTRCRVCIEKGAECTLLNTKIQNSSNLTFFDFLNKCTSLNACESDKLPQSLCSICTRIIRTFYTFVKLAEKSDTILREALKKTIATERCNDNREISWEEITIRNEMVEEESEDLNEEDSFHCQRSTDAIGSSFYILDIVEEERISERPPSVARISESDEFHPNLDHPELYIEEPVDILSSSCDGHLESIDTKYRDSEDDGPISLLRSLLTKNKDETDSQSTKNGYENHIKVTLGCRNQVSTEAMADSLKPHLRGHIENTKYRDSEDDGPISLLRSILTKNKDETDSQSTKNGYENHIKVALGCRNQVSTEATADSLKPHLRGHIENTYKCKECDMVFNDKEEFRTHCRNHICGDKHECNICGKKFAKSKKLRSHLRIHNDKNKYKCSICGKGFKHLSSQQGHMRIHTREKPFKCEICSKKFGRKEYLNRHMESHDGVSKKCGQCDKEFKYAQTLREHMKLHINPRRFKCEKCGQLFNRKFTCTRHMEICKPVGNSNEEAHQKGHMEKTCKECDIVFKGKEEFEAHCRDRGCINKHECNICGKMFARQQYLQYHLEIHKENKKYECTICGKDFKHASALTYHMNIHSSEKPFECKICSKKFKTKYCLEAHLKRHNGVIKKCGQCGKELKNSYTLYRHMQRHTNSKLFKCENCGKLFASIHSVTRHMEICKPIGTSNEGTVTIEKSSSHSKGSKEVIVNVTH